MSDHGTYSRYCNGRCRCEPCREAQRRYHQWKTAGRNGPRPTPVPAYDAAPEPAPRPSDAGRALWWAAQQLTDDLARQTRIVVYASTLGVDADGLLARAGRR